MRPNSESTGPYTCSKCGYKATTSRAMLQHSNNRHEDPLSLVFTDNTGREVRILDLFITVGRCKAPGCGLVFGNSDTRESVLYNNVRLHWRSQHSEQTECEDSDKVEILLGRTVNVRTMECGAGGCKWTQETGEHYWKKKCLDHFLNHHGDDLRQLRFRDSEERSLRIQDLYSHVGQCSQESCRHKIARDSQSLLDRSFTCHYKNHHPSLKTAYTPLVENGEVNVTSIISADHIKCKPCKVNLYNI